MLNLIGKRSRPALTIALLLAVFTHLAVAGWLVIPTSWPVVVLIIATLVKAARLFLHGVWRVPHA